MRNKIGNTIYFIILIPLIIITISILYQKIFYSDKIPDIFGYKMFIVFDENMDSSLKYGDLVITNDKQMHNLKENDMVAYRNGDDIVTIHRINKTEEKNVKPNEGKVVNIIPHIGDILYFIQKPINILMISGAILGTGGIGIYIANKLDQKEMQNINNELEKSQQNIEDDEMKVKDKKTISV